MVFIRDQLMEQVWGMDFYGESRTVDLQKLPLFLPHFAEWYPVLL